MRPRRHADYLVPHSRAGGRCAQRRQLLALFIGTIIAIIGKAMPIGAVSVIAIAPVAVTGVTNPGKPGAALDDALSGFPTS